MSPDVRATGGVPRLLRGAVLAGCCAGLTATAHAVAGGALPPFGSTAVLTLLLAGLGVALADRRRGFPAILAVVAGSQVVLHALLAGHGHGPPWSGLSATMVTLHAVAAVLLAAVLTGAEGTAFALAAGLRWLLRRMPAAPLWALPAPGPRVARIVVATPAGSLVTGVLLRRVHSRRGPPYLP